MINRKTRDEIWSGNVAAATVTGSQKKNCYKQEKLNPLKSKII